MSNMFDRALQLDRETQGQGQQLGGSMFDRAMQIQAEEDAKAQANMPEAGESANTETGERGFFDAAISGVKAGTAGVYGGQLDFANTFAGVGGDAADYMNDVAQSNARRKTYTIAEMLPFASDYWTNPEGATYDAASQVGSMAALGGEAALLSAGMSAAGIGGAGALASTAAAKAAQMGLPWLARILNSKAGVAMVGNMLTTPFEAGSEAGSTGRTVRDEGGSKDEQQSAALKNFGVQMGLLGITNTLESIGFGRLIAEAGGKRAFTKTLAGLFGNAAQQMYEEGAQTTADEYARGKQTIANVFNPAGWSDEAWDSAGAGFTGGLILGTGARAAGHVLNRNTTTAENFGEDAVNGALEEGRASANEQTETTQDATEPAANNISEKEAFINAIGGQESGGNYDAVNGRTGAAGKYQIMPDNWPQWAEEAGLSRDAEMTPENQEIVARFKLGQYYDKYGARGAAIAWYAGEGALEYSDDALNRKQGNGDEPSINEYADSVLARMGEVGNTNSSSPDYNAARDYLRNQLEEMEAGEEYNSIDDTLNNGSRDDVISLAIQRGFGRQEETQTTQQPEQTGEETQQPEGEQGGLSVTDAIDNVRDTTRQVVQNGGQPTFNQPTQQEPTTATPVETPAVDNIRGQQGDIVTDVPPAQQPTQTTQQPGQPVEAPRPQQPAGEQQSVEPHKPSTKAETQLANLQKKFKNIADRGEHLGVQLSPERIAELREVAETGDAGRVIDMAKRYKLRAGKDLREMAKQQREAQKQPVEQFNPDAGNVQEPTSESTESGSQTVQTPQEQGGDNSFEQVRGEMSEYIQKLKPTSGKLGKLGSVSTFLHKALKAKRITPQQLGQLKKEAADIIEGKTPTSETVEPNTRAQKDERTSGGDGLTKEPAVADNKGTEAQNVADNEGGEANGNTEERSGVGDLPRADGKVQTEQVRSSESGSVQERPEGHGELGSVQGVRGRVRLNEGGEANGNTEERGRVGDLPRNDSGSGERPGVREVGEEKNRNVQERPEGQDELGGVQRTNEDVQLKHKTPKGADKVNALRKKQGLPALNFYVSDDREAFSASLARAKVKNKRGDYVDPKTPDELKGCTLIMLEGADVGVAVTPDGDIVAVHNGSDIKQLGQSLILLARENGGKKMDCFGKRLVNLYNSAGFKAVAKVPFAEGIMDSKLLNKEKPDVFALMVTDETTEQVIKNGEAGAVEYQTREELDALPTYEGADGYDNALKHRDDLLKAQEEGQNGSKSEPKNRKTETGDNVQAEVHQERAEESNNQDEVTAEPDSWRTAADDLLGADFNKLMDEATTTRQRRRRNREAQEREEAETVAAVRAVELTAEEQQERQAADAVNSYIDSLPTTKKAAIAKHFKNKPDRKDFCARVVTKNPKVTMRERISPSGRDNSEYFVTYDGIELPEKISKNEAQVIAGVAKVKIEKQAPQPAKLPEKPAKPKYLAEIPKTAVKDFLNEVSEKLGPQVASRYLDELMKISGDNGMTWGKSIRNGVFKDLQSRGGINESGWYSEHLMRLKDGEVQDALYMYLWDKYAPLVKKTSRGEYNNGDNFSLSEQDMLNEFKRIMGKGTSNEQAQHVLDYANSVYPNINLDELPASELKRLVAEAQEARPADDRIVRKVESSVSDQDFEALIAEANAKLDETSGRQYQIAGLNATTANYSAFNEAQTMREKGKSAKEIFEKTGWIYGRDRKWRFVIPDRLDLVDYTKLKNGKAKLNEVYPHELLYEAYPWLRDIDVVVANIDALGASDTSLKRIVLSPNVVNGTEASELTRDSRTTLLHEIQHHIQHFEQFAEGGSPETARKIVQERIDTLVDEAASASKWYRGYYEARIAYEDMLADKNVSDERKANAERELRAFENEYIPNPRSRAAIMRAMREADQLRKALKKYSNDQLYDMLYGEREAQRVEQDSVIRGIAEQAVKDGDDRKLLRALIARDNNILLDDDKTNPLYNKDVIVVFGNEKARALQMSVNRDNDKLDNFSAELLGSLIRVGDALIQRGFDTAGSFRNAMISTFRNNAERVRPLLDSIWEFLRKLPSNVAVKSKEMLQALVVAGRAFNDNISNGKMKSMLKNGMPDLYNSIKDYLDAAFAAIRHYPRQNSGNVVELNKENEGGGSNEHVRVAGTDVEGGNSRRAGEPLERRAGFADDGSENQSQARDNQANGRNVLGRFGLPDNNSSVHRSGTAVGGEQGNQQGGGQNASDTQRSTRDSERAGSGGPDGTRNIVTEGEVGRNAETDASVRGSANAQFGEQSAPGVREIQTAKQQGTSAERSNLTTENIPIEAGNAENVRRTLPLLFKEQQDDVIKTEKRMFKDNGKGMLLANGTGTGKTLTGMGLIKRFMMQGKRNILIVVPTSDIANNWIYEGQRLGIDGMNTITTNKFTPDDVNVITYASLYQNKSLLDNQWDLVVCDESHYLASGSNSTEETPTAKVQALRAIIGHERGFDGWMLLKHGAEIREVENLNSEATKLQNRAVQLATLGNMAGAELYRMKAAEMVAKYQKALTKLRALERKEEPLFKEYQRKNSSKVLMLSATPFSYSADVYAAEGILFSYEDYGDYRGFMVDRFGYGITQNGKLKAPKGGNTANEVAFHDQLVSDGAMSNRRLMVDKDYNRKFVQVSSGIGAEIDRGFDILNDERNGYTESDLTKYMNQRFDYQTKKRILESLKAEASVPMIKEYIRQGKKVVLFHDTKIDKPLIHPFKIERAELEKMPVVMQLHYQDFRKAHPELVNLDLGQLKTTLEIMRNAFGNDVLAINGDVSKTQKAQAVKIFNDDASASRNRDDSTNGNLIMLTVDAGKEGISLHDTTGEHPRVLINLGMPTKPTDAIQMEGRIYRVGQASNAMFRYLATGTKMEKRAFMERVATRSRSAENMALGKEARELDATFADGFMEAITDMRIGEFDVTKDAEDSGGKAKDNRSAQQIMKDIRDRGIDDEYLLAKINEMDEAYKTERDENIRREMLTPANERRFVTKLKEAFNAKGVVKAADGVYVVQLPIPRNVWIDLNTSQAEVLADMSEAEKKRLRSAADVQSSNFRVQGFYEPRGYLKEAGNRAVDIIHLTEAAEDGTLHHEFFHFVHNALLKTKEKKWLAEYYLRKLRKEIGAEAFNAMSSAERMNRVYEMEAEDYRRFVKMQESIKGPLANLFNRFRNFVAQIADAIGLHTPYGLYLQVRSGKLYTRGVAKNSARKAAAQADAEAMQAQAGPEVLQVAEREDGTRQYSIAEDGTIDGKRTKDDIAATLAAANERAEKAAEEGGIIVKEREKTDLEKKGEAPVFFKELVSSPSRIAEKYPVFKSFYNIYKRAQDTQEKLRNRWNKNFNTALGHLKTEEDMEQFLDLQVSGEMEQQEYTAKQLLGDGYSENVVKAYTQTRQLIRNIWGAVNDAHRGLKTYNEKVDTKGLRSLVNDKFVENLVIKDDISGKFVPARGYKPVPGMEYEVRYDKAKVYKSTRPEPMSQEQLDELRQSPYVKVTGVKKVDFYGGVLQYYEVTTERVTPPIGKITGYLPHMFEQWMVMVETEDGMRPIGSGKTLKEAYAEANKFQKSNPKLKIYVEPKVFDPNTFMGDGDESSSGKFTGSDAVVVSDSDYIRLARALVENNRMSVAEAKAALDGAVRRSGRNRFFGALRQRKGRTGYNTDIIATLGRYITQSSRYVAMQPAKSTAIPLYERTFRKSYETKTSTPMERLIQDYIRYNNGTPTKWEKELNEWLNSMPWWRDNLQATYGDRAALALTNKINSQVSKAKLGFLNVSSAIVNMSQLMNTIGLIGYEATGKGIAAMQRMNTLDKRVIIETGVRDNIGMDSSGGFSADRRGGSDWRKKKATTALGKFWQAYNDIADKSMILFKKTDTITRLSTTLGAYYYGIDQGMSHKQAIAYARDINNKANFDYGAADAPGAFRKLSGTILGDLFLMFRKYPVKELEMMAEMAPWSNRSTMAQKARFWGTYFMLAGLFGFPGADYLDELLEQLLGYKPSVLAKAWLFKTFGDSKLTRALAYGMGGAAGVDVSRRVGLADVVPSEDSLWKLVGGPTGSTITQFVTAAANGDGAGVVKAWSPALGHAVDAWRGYRTNTKGQIAARYEGLDRALKATGFRPVEEAITGDMQSAVYAERTRYRNERAAVMRRVAEKQLNGEQLTKEDYDDLRRLKVTGKQLMDARRKMGMTNKERIQDSLTRRDRENFAGTPLDE